MKGLVLAGGDGTRLEPLSHTTPKHLLPVANRPVIEHVLADLRSSGITDVGIVVGNSTAEAITAHVGDGSEFGVDVTYVHQGKPLGLAHAVGCARPYLCDEPFVVYFGDTILGESVVDRLLETFEPGRQAAGLTLTEVDQPSRFGIVERAGDEIRRVLEKPADPPTNLAYMGAVAFSPVVFSYIADLEPSDRGELELTDAIDALAVAGESVGYRVADALWKDVGTPADLLETNRHFLADRERRVEGEVEFGATVRGRVEVGPGSVVERDAVVEGPVSIGAGTTIEVGTRIGPYTSIGDDCTVANASVESSVVLDDVTIRTGDHIVDSIIGRGTTFTTDDRVGLRVVVGDSGRMVK